MDIKELNEQQRLAVTTIDGPVMVMAGAGSGKTRVLTYRIAYILENTYISPYNILAVTFTNKAAKEMKERISTLIDMDTSKMWISTFHSFCARLLRLEVDDCLKPYNHNFVIIDEDDALKIIKNILKEESLDEYKPRDIKNLISKNKNVSNFVIKDLYFKRFFNKINDKYNQYLKTNNMMDFDDLINKTIELFKGNPQILEKYQNKFAYILVDEFQDTNDLQYKLIYMLASRHHNLFVVGDDFQSIYSFRGAKIENINRFRNDYLEHKLILLEQNYRSTSHILNLANTVIEKNPNQIKKVMFTEKKSGQIPFYYEAYSSKDEAMFVVDKIKQLHQSNYKYKDFAIIYRTNSISRVFEDYLIKFQIPYKIYGGLSFFARKEIKDMIAYLRLIVNYDDDFSFARIVNEPKRKIGSALIEKLTMYALDNNLSLFKAIESFEASGVGFKALKNFAIMIKSINEQLNNIPLKNVIDILLDETGYRDMLAVEDPEHERIGNIFELKNVLKETDDTVDGDNFDKLRSLLNDLSLRTDEEQENSDSVVLSTYHQVKGLEFKNVFLVAMEEGIFPSQYHFDDLDIEEERRICYVGVTRAMENLYVTMAKTRMLYGRTECQSPSRFIKEMGKEYLKPITNDLVKPVISWEKTEKKIVNNNLEKNESYNVGDKVEHNVFGVGIIVSVDATFLNVAFKAPTGVKKLMKGHPSYHKI